MVIKSTCHFHYRRFAGSDTWATSYTLAAAMRKLGQVDVVVAGERATDGDTAQVGPGIAAWLDLPLATYVARIESLERQYLTVERLVEEGYQSVTLRLPALITVVKEIASVRLPTLRGKKRAKQLDVPVWTASDLQVDFSSIGLKGSPTKVVRIERPKVSRSGELVHANGDGGVDGAVDRLVAFLEQRGLLEEVSG